MYWNLNKFKRRYRPTKAFKTYISIQCTEAKTKSQSKNIFITLKSLLQKQSYFLRCSRAVSWNLHPFVSMKARLLSTPIWIAPFFTISSVSTELRQGPWQDTCTNCSIELIYWRKSRSQNQQTYWGNVQEKPLTFEAAWTDEVVKLVYSKFLSSGKNPNSKPDQAEVFEENRWWSETNWSGLKNRSETVAKCCWLVQLRNI